MYRVFAAAWLAAASVASAPATAQETQASADPAPTVVMGLSPGDTLRIREQASPLSRTVRHAENGEALRNLGCEKIDNYEWCKVETTVEPKATGWTPARYLSGVDAGTTAATEAEQAAATKVVSLSDVELPASSLTADDPFLPEVPPIDPAARPDPDAPVAAEAPAEPTEVAALQPAAEPSATAAAPPVAAGLAAPSDADMSARFGSPDPTPKADPVPDPSGSIGYASINDAYGLAYLAPEGTGNAAASASSASEIPCARYVGQPMTRCETRIARVSDTESDITVIWPDGGQRIIRFSKERPVQSKESPALRSTREGSLNMIRVGDAERFEILDSQATGG